MLVSNANEARLLDPSSDKYGCGVERTGEEANEAVPESTCLFGANSSSLISF